MQSVIEWTDWHLTPHGWTPGTTKLDSTEYVISPPPDRLLTCRYSESKAAGSPTTIPRTRLIWELADGRDRDRLIARFGSCPQELHVVRIDRIDDASGPSQPSEST
jgi:hypothetical protein